MLGCCKNPDVSAGKDHEILSGPVGGVWVLNIKAGLVAFEDLPGDGDGFYKSAHWKLYTELNRKSLEGIETLKYVKAKGGQIAHGEAIATFKEVNNRTDWFACPLAAGSVQVHEGGKVDFKCNSGTFNGFKQVVRAWVKLPGNSPEMLEPYIDKVNEAGIDVSTAMASPSEAYDAVGKELLAHFPEEQRKELDPKGGKFKGVKLSKSVQEAVEMAVSKGHGTHKLELSKQAKAELDKLLEEESDLDDLLLDTSAMSSSCPDPSGANFDHWRATMSLNPEAKLAAAKVELTTLETKLKAQGLSAEKIQHNKDVIALKVYIQALPHWI